MVLTDTIGQTFDGLFADANEGTDAYVRSRATSTDGLESRRSGPGSTHHSLRRSSHVDGVAAAARRRQGYAQLVGKRRQGRRQPRTRARRRRRQLDRRSPSSTRTTSSTARPPTADDEIVIDKHTADDGQLPLGDQVTRPDAEPARRSFTIVGHRHVRHGRQLGGATVGAVHRRHRQRLLWRARAGRRDRASSPSRRRVTSRAHRSHRARRCRRAPRCSPATRSRRSSRPTPQADGLLQHVPDGLRLHRPVRRSFIIDNTFSIIVAQRTRRWRCSGDRRQPPAGHRSVLVEALVVGLIASVAGLVAGVGVAAGLKALLRRDRASTSPAARSSSPPRRRDRRS